MERTLDLLGFTAIGDVVNGLLVYRPDARQVAGEGGAVYVFVNPDGRVWKVGMTWKGFSRVDYTRVFDGRAMTRPHEQDKLRTIRSEVQDGATQWVLRTDQPELVEALLATILEPTESKRKISKVERVLREIRPAGT